LAYHLVFVNVFVEIKLRINVLLGDRTMSYPEYVLVTLTEVGGSSCGPKTHRMKLDGSASPPEYGLDGSGDFTWARLRQATINSVTSWELGVYIATSPCNGMNTLWRSPGADDPTGTFFVVRGSVADEDYGVATIADDS